MATRMFASDYLFFKEVFYDSGEKVGDDLRKVVRIDLDKMSHDVHYDNHTL